MPDTSLTEEISSTRVLLCEGAGDAAFFKHLIELRNLPDFYITYPAPFDKTEPGGRDGFPTRLRALRLARQFKDVTGVLVVSDNDSDPRVSFRLVRTRIHEAGSYPAPNRPLEVAFGIPPVVIYMLPAQDTSGQIETLCLTAMNDTWPDHAQCVEEFRVCAPNVATWSQGKQERMRLRAMITSICRKDPNTSLSYAWDEGRGNLIPLDHHRFDAVADFLSGFDALIAAAHP